MLTTPKVINSSSSKDCTAKNYNVKLQCWFNASTMDGAVIVVWLKDHLVLSGYNNETKPVKGEDNLLIATLYMKSFTHEDQGNYTCHLHYNQSMVTSNKSITSAQATINVHSDCASEKGKDQL